MTTKALQAKLNLLSNDKRIGGKLAYSFYKGITGDYDKRTSPYFGLTHEEHSFQSVIHRIDSKILRHDELVMKIYAAQEMFGVKADHIIDMESLWIRVARDLRMIPDFNTLSPELTRECNQMYYVPMLLYNISELQKTGAEAIAHMKNGKLVITETKLKIKCN